MDHEQSLLLECLQLLQIVELRTGHQFIDKRSVLFGRVRQNGGNELVEEMPAARAPIPEGVMKAAVILCGLTDSAAHDQRPALGLLEYPDHIGMCEPHVARFGQMTDLFGAKR